MDNQISGRDTASGAAARRVGALLLTASEAARAAGNAALEPLGIGVRHFAVITFLAHEEAGDAAGGVHDVVAGGPATGMSLVSQQAIGEALRIDRTTMVSLIDALERCGLVRRERNPADRRAYSIRLTAEGHRLQAQAEQELDVAAAAFFAPLSAREQATLRDQLARLIEGSRAGPDA
jgi:DNA-binding MarR family transcriptional regulator